MIETVRRKLKRLANPEFAFWVSFALIWTVIAICLGLSNTLNNPRPTDDMFYIDAAWRLQDGSYRAPSPAAPYHHYLRWPVVLPLSFVIWLFGSSEVLFRTYTMAYAIAISAMLALIARKLSQSLITRSFAALTPLLLPSFIFSPRILSEYPAVAWFCLGLALIVYASARRYMLFLLAAGGCAALSINAAQVGVFATPALWVLAFARFPVSTTRWTRATRTALPLIAGAIGAYTVIIAAEWIAFGDPLIQVKSITMWHLSSVTSDAGFLSDVVQHFSKDMFDPSNVNFIFGFSVQIMQKASIYSLLLVALLLLFQHRPTGKLGAIALAAAVALASMELLAPIVADKTYVRFISIPLTLLTFIAMVGAAETLQRATSNFARLAIIIPLFALAAFTATENFKEIPDDDHTLRLRPVFRLLAERASAAGLSQDEVAIFVGLPSTPGLIPMAWATNVYTDFRFADNLFFDLDSALSNSTPHRFVIVEGGLPDDLVKAGFKEVPNVNGQASAVRLFELTP